MIVLNLAIKTTNFEEWTTNEIRDSFSPVDRVSPKDGVFNYIETNGVKVTHMILFKPRSTRSQLTAIINVPIDQAD